MFCKHTCEIKCTVGLVCSLDVAKAVFVRVLKNGTTIIKRMTSRIVPGLHEYSRAGLENSKKSTYVAPDNEWTSKNSTLGYEYV